MNLNQIYKIVLTNNSNKNNTLTLFNKFRFKYKSRKINKINKKIYNKFR
jgi:hypothetical protein